MLKKSFTLLFLLGVFSFSFYSCQRNDTPPSLPNVLQSTTNDAMGAIGGVQAAMSVGGPPMTIGHVICYAAIGTWTGLSASGAFQFSQTNWQSKYGSNMNIENINQQALALYNQENLEYAKLGKLHNDMLHKWATSNSTFLFGNNSSTKDFMRNNFDSTANFANPCEGGFHYGIEDSLTTIGTTSNVNITTLQELENQFNILAQQNPNLAEGINLIKGITVNACNMYIAENYDQLRNYLHQEVNKVNSNFYSLDLSNLTAAVAMINIVTYSYYYWVIYES